MVCIKKEKSNWENAGFITVDAGLIWIGDPGYVFGEDRDEGVKDWGAFCDKLGDDNVVPFKHDNGNPGLGIAVGTACDGMYEVEVKRDSEGFVREVRIKL